MLEAVTRERLMNTQQVGKVSAVAVVICELWNLAVGAVIACISESCVFVINKSNLQSKLRRESL
jgi:hypothetical protein